MIFYFSGTGNSEWIARQVAAYQNEKLISIADEMIDLNNTFQYTLGESEMIGFVFPVYSWAPPAIVKEFIKKICFTNYNSHYCFFICSCGDEAGLTLKIMHEVIRMKEWEWKAAFSVIMPNNYVSLPGFDTDPKELEKKKLDDSVGDVQRINGLLESRTEYYFDCKKGSFAFLKSRIINPLFNKYQVTSKPFYATDDCISCGLCEKHCPMHNVKVDEKPVWGDNCTSCLACYHICPRHAIHYGKATLKKHQYFHPEHKRY
ncbi:EFR1 family ferrodoxin [uncultured Bacteroides sp.]|uniref:EFR1 family ferrodoxin n=1 Tax=uncultured Bacteroides sp. TaxID=162156 RepID=UPI002AAB2EDC|nr:EFR1 family ferrodoxin [uncultured Bacteroides sp.]